MTPALPWKKSEGHIEFFGFVLVLDDGRAERVQIFYSYYGRQEVGFTGRAVVSAWIYCFHLAVTSPSEPGLFLTLPHLSHD